jgi:flagellar biogenesis protein FliO
MAQQKNKIYLILIAFIFFGCGEQKTQEIKLEINTKASWGLDVHVRLIEVDSCEYIVSTRHGAISTIHKQNCKFCEQRKHKPNNMAQQTEEEMEQYMQKLIEKFKQDPKWELQQDFGRMLMRHIDSFTNEERVRYEQLKELLKD